VNLAAGLTQYRSVLRHRDLRHLFAAEIISATGSWAYNVALAVYVFDRTHSALWVSAIFLVRFIPAMLLSAYGGILAERVERVRLLASSDLLMMAWQILLAITVAFSGPVALALVFSSFTSISATPYSPAVAAMIPQLAGEDDLTAANALNSTIDNVVIIVGPAVGALLLILGSPTLVFAVNAASFGASALLVHSLRTRSHPSDVTEAGGAGPFLQMWRGLQTVIASGSVFVLVSFSVLASFVYGTDTVLFVYVSKLQLGTGATGYGYLLAALGVGGILAALVVNQLAAMPRLGAVITIGMAVYCVPTFFLIFVHSPELGFLLEVIRGGGTLVVDVLAITALQRSVSSQMVARVFGVFFALVLGAISLGSVLAAVLESTLTLHPTLVVMGLGVPALAALAYPWLHRMDNAAVRGLAAIRSKVELLGTLGIFATGSRPILEQLARACADEACPAGTVIIREGDPADSFYVLRSGQVDVSARGEGAQPKHLRTMSAGSYFGEIGLLEQIPRTATVTAIQDCQLYRISGDDFLNALNAAPASQPFLDGTRARLTLTHPSYRSSHLAATETGS
jgi:predicted MFS family arabinose efflux permease